MSEKKKKFFCSLYSNMDIVLEIDKYCVRVGVVGEVTPVVVPVKYEWVGEVQYLEDHALTKEQAQAVVLEMDKGVLAKYCQSLGTWLDVENVLYSLLQRLVHGAFSELPVNPRRCFVVDHRYSEKLKRAICSILFEYRAKSVVFVPGGALAVMGSNRRDGLWVDHTRRVIHKVVDLREIGVYGMDVGIHSIIQKSDIHVRKTLKENVITAKDTVGCWTACSLYVGEVATGWPEIRKDIFR